MDPEPVIFLTFSFNFTVVIYSVLLITLLICSALISGAEVAFFSLSQTDLDAASQSKSKAQQHVVSLLNKPKKLLASILIANNFINILIVLLFAVLGEIIFANLTYNLNLYFFNVSIRFLLEVVLITFLILLFGEVLPKVYATRNSLKFASFMVFPLKYITSFLSFLSIPLLGLTNFVEKKLGAKQSNLSVENLSKALELTAEDATTTEEQKILEGIVNFGNTETIQIMTPRTEIFGISKDEDFSEMLKKITKKGFSRNPVYQENIDNIVGVIYTKDLLAHLDKKEFDWHSLLKEPYFVPENKKLDDLLVEFKSKKNHLAVVVDEYGGTSGIVTLQDVIEEIVGDITDEYDEDDLNYSKLDAHNYVFEAKTTLKDFCKVLQIDEALFEDSKGESETIAGFLLELYGKFPKKKEKIHFKNFTFTIESVDRKRIKQVKITMNE